MASKDGDKGKDKEKDKSKAKAHPQGDAKQQKAEAKAAKEKEKEKDKAKAKEGAEAAKGAKEAKEEKPKAPPRPPADPRLKVLKKFHGKFLPRGPLRDRLKVLMDRWNSGEEHGGVTVEELKSLHNDWKVARQKPAKRKAASQYRARSEVTIRAIDLRASEPAHCRGDGASGRTGNLAGGRLDRGAGMLVGSRGAAGVLLENGQAIACLEERRVACESLLVGLACRIELALRPSR